MANGNNGFQIQGADGPLEVPPKEYYRNTKARCRRMMENHLSKEARRVYACLELHTMSFAQEKAVIMVPPGRIRDLTTTDIAAETGLDGSSVRRALDELDDEGLAERRGKDGGPLQKGNVQIYSWAEPHPDPAKKRARAPGKKGEDPNWIPEALQPLTRFLKRNRLSLPEEISLDDPLARALLSEGEQLARAREELDMKSTRWAEQVRALERLYNVETKETEEEEEPSSSDSLQLEEEPTTTNPNPEPIPPIPTSEDPIENIPVEEPEPVPGTPRDPDIGTLTGQLGIDRNAARRMWRDVKAVRPDATALEIVRACFWKARQVNGKADNLVGMWIVYLPQMAESDQWLDIRAELAREGYP
jgi:hypothetical protein